MYEKSIILFIWYVMTYEAQDSYEQCCPIWIWCAFIAYEMTYFLRTYQMLCSIAVTHYCMALVCSCWKDDFVLIFFPTLLLANCGSWCWWYYHHKDKGKVNYQTQQYNIYLVTFVYLLSDFWVLTIAKIKSKWFQVNLAAGSLFFLVLRCQHKFHTAILWTSVLIYCMTHHTGWRQHWMILVNRWSVSTACLWW